MLAFLIFAFVSSITPGPNNTMLLISGVNFGFKRTLPHMLGVTFGFCVLVAVSSLGLGGVLIRCSFIYNTLRCVCVLYLLYLAWQMLRVQEVRVDNTSKKPISFLQALLFQWINPKAWIMCIVIVTTYVPQEQLFLNTSILMLVFLFFVFFSSGVWTLFGNWIQRFLYNPIYLRLFNLSMAVLLISSLYPLFQKTHF